MSKVPINSISVPLFAIPSKYFISACKIRINFILPCFRGRFQIQKGDDRDNKVDGVLLVAARAIKRKHTSFPLSLAFNDGMEDPMQ